ncbi:uncharacterized protein LOC144871672 isoform X1 [Branchiostoma floridae x Branchiostoma japonicum]
MSWRVNIRDLMNGVPHRLNFHTFLPRVHQDHTRGNEDLRRSVPYVNHVLSTCPFLSGEEKSYPRPPHQRPDNVGDSPRAQARGVSVRALPRLDAFHEGHAIRINLKSGAETSLIRAAEAQRLNLPVRKSQHAANLKSIQADGRRLSVIEAATAQVEVGYQLSPPTSEASTAHEGEYHTQQLKGEYQSSLPSAEGDTQQLKGEYQPSPPSAEGDTQQLRGENQPSLPSAEGERQQLKGEYQPSPPSAGDTQQLKGENQPSLPSAEGDTQQLKGEYQPSPPSAEGDTQQLRGENQPSLPSAEGERQQLKGEYQPSPPSAEGDTQQLRGENQPSLPSAEGDTQQLKGEYQSSPP